MGRRERARAVSYVPQSPEMPADMSVFDYILLGRTPHISYLAVESSDDVAHCLRLLERLDLGLLARRHLSTLSGGERQRVVLARALAQEAPVLLMDEPTSALDMSHRVEALEIVDELRREWGLTVVSALHDLTLAGQFADRLLLMSGGTVAALGSPAEVLDEAVLEKAFGAPVRIIRTEDGEVIVAPQRTGMRRSERRGQGRHGERGGTMSADATKATDAPEPRVPLPTHEDPSPARRRVDSVVVVNTGDGKGKSTAAFGVMVRGWARGWRVGVVQFMKSGDWKVGERKLADHLDVDWWTLGDGFTWESTDLDESAAKNIHAWGVARDKLASGDYDLLVLDELTYVVNYGWVSVGEVVDGVRRRAPKTNVVITGRDAPPELIEIADTVTEMRMVKHAYEQGVRAMKGIEY